MIQTDSNRFRMILELILEMEIFILEISWYDRTVDGRPILNSTTKSYFDLYLGLLTRVSCL